LIEKPSLTREGFAMTSYTISRTITLILLSVAFVAPATAGDAVSPSGMIDGLHRLPTGITATESIASQMLTANHVQQAVILKCGLVSSTPVDEWICTGLGSKVPVNKLLTIQQVDCQATATATSVTTVLAIMGRSLKGTAQPNESLAFSGKTVAALGTTATLNAGGAITFFVPPGQNPGFDFFVLGTSITNISLAACTYSGTYVTP
jgi:hypothetical protein